MLFPVKLRRVGRVYHPYSSWEEYQYGMWRDVSGAEHAEFLSRAIAFTGDAEGYGVAMMRVVDEWPISCEHNMTCLNMNRHAWIGQAAVALECDIPEQVTREAWHHLTETQRNEANAVATLAIEAWEARYGR